MCDPLTNVPIYRVNEAGVTWVERVSFRDTDEATDYIAGLAIEDAPRLADVAQRITKGARSKLEALAMAHDWIQQHVGYADDDECEAFASPLAVLKKGADDCDGHAALMAGLAVALGCCFALPNMNGSREYPDHITAWVADPAELGGAGVGRWAVENLASTMTGRGALSIPVDAPIWAPLRMYGTPPGWHWAETTIAARFDEHPADALARLGVHRADIAG